jgi:tripartite-type tricarboxylate transporter receptor subunit TctC
VRWLIGFPPGGAVDIVARIMGHWLSEHFGQQFLVENRAVGLVATGIVALSLESVGVALVFFGIGGLLIKLA